MSKHKLTLVAVSGTAALAGVITGLLTAPKSGKETRDELRDQAEHLKDDVDRKRISLSSALGRDQAQVRHSLRRSAREMSDLVEDAKLRAARVAHDARKTSQIVADDITMSLRA